MFDEEKLRAFGRLVVRLQQRTSLSREETRDAFRQIWRSEQPDLQQGAFIAALRCKGETKDELTGVTESHNEEWSRYFPHEVRAPEPHLGVVGVGMDTLKTINVSSGAAVIAAACGVYVHKVGAPALTGLTGSADIFSLWGVDTDVPGEVSVRATERGRLGFTSAVGPDLLRSGIGRVLSQLRIGTSIHIAGPLGFHVGERHKIMGVPDPKLTRVACEVMRDMGYKAAMVPCGASREHPELYIDELSNIGLSHVAELTEDGSILEYDIAAGDVGLREASYADIASLTSREENARAVARALAGKLGGPALDILALNAAACLKVMGKVKDLASGVSMAKQAVEDGRALAQLRTLIELQNRDPQAGLARLSSLLAD
jgi:anthranilate phosphoribosyltransferase